MTDLHRVLNKLAKWRILFTGWQLGTRVKGDPEGDAVRDHREVTILLRAEVSALTAILVTKGICTREDFEAALTTEAMLLDRDYEQRFPGVESDESGLKMDAARIKLAGWMNGWKP